MKTFNLLIGFAFVGFGFQAIHLIGELRSFVGQELLAHFLFFWLLFVLSFIAWALSYVMIKQGKNQKFYRHLADLEKKYPMQKRNAQGRFIK